jgi:hypothetical protein
LPRCSCRVQFNNGRSRSLQRRERYVIERRSLKWWHCLLYFHFDRATVNSFIMCNLHNVGQHDQISFRVGLVRQLTVVCEIKRRGITDFLTKNKLRISRVPDDVRLREVGKHLPVRITRKRCRQCSTSKH